jgi:hypothetical protein
MVDPGTSMIQADHTAPPGDSGTPFHCEAQEIPSLALIVAAASTLSLGIYYRPLRD